MAQVTYEIDILGERRVIEKLSDISKLSTEIQQKLNNTKFADANYQSLIRSQQALQGVANQVNVYNQALGSMSRTGSQAGIALQNLNFVIRDSPYFLKDMQLGVLAVGNNINPLIDSFIRLRLEAQRLSAETGKTVTTMSLLKGALVGGVGLSVALSLAVTAFQAFIFAQQRSKSESISLTDSIIKQVKGVNDLATAYRELDTKQLTSATDALNQKLQEQYDIIRKRLDLTLLMGELGGAHLGLLGKLFGYNVDLTDSEIKALKEIRENLDAIDKVKESEGRIPKLKKEIAELEKLRDAIPEGVSQVVYDSYNKRIKELQAELDLLLGKEKKITKEKENQEKSVIIQFKTAQEYFDWLQNKTNRDPRSEYFARLDKRYKEGDTEAIYPQLPKKVKKGQEEFNVDLEVGKILANEMGDALEQMMIKGTIAFDKLIQSILIAIAKMAILRAITSALFPVAAPFTYLGSPVPASQVPIPLGGTLKKDGRPTFIFENKIDTQEIVYKGIKKSINYTR